jgi:regulator of sirC expression with transglutaminase-like and TPR domain
MDGIIVTESSSPLSANQQAALVKLLEDDDPAVFQTVHAKIVSFGPNATVWLRPYALTSNPRLRKRIHSLLHHFARDAADNEFLGFCLGCGEELDMERAAWLLARTRYPDISTEGYSALLDHFAEELKDRMYGETGASFILPVINRYLFEELGFSGDHENYFSPENSYLNRVVDRRVGNPVNLSLLYLLLARRLNLPVAGVGLPEHFVCRYQSSSIEVFIDPFHKGRLLSKADCMEYLIQGQFSPHQNYLAPISPRRLFLRICSNLHHIFVHQDQPEEATRVQRYCVALGHR